MKIQRFALVLSVAVAAFACGAPPQDSRADIEIVNPQSVGALQGITVSSFGELFVLGSEGIASLDEQGNLSLIADLQNVPTRGDVFTDLFIVNDGSFALANSDEVVRYYPESQTLEPFYCFEPGFIGGEPDPITVPSDVLAVEPNYSTATAWGVQRTTLEDGMHSELRGYRFGQAEEAAHVIEIPGSVEVRGLTFLDNMALIVDAEGALFTVNIETSSFDTHSVQIDAKSVEGMTASNDTLFVLDAEHGVVHQYDIDSIR